MSQTSVAAAQAATHRRLGRRPGRQESGLHRSTTRHRPRRSVPSRPWSSASSPRAGTMTIKCPIRKRVIDLCYAQREWIGDRPDVPKGRCERLGAYLWLTGAQPGLKKKLLPEFWNEGVHFPTTTTTYLRDRNQQSLPKRIESPQKRLCVNLITPAP